MHKCASVLVIVSMLFVLSACWKTDKPVVICPAFSDNPFESWFPHTYGQQLVFKNIAGATDTITIGSVIGATAAYTLDARQYTTDSCRAGSMILSNEKTDSGFVKLFLHDDLKTGGRVAVSFYLHGFRLECDRVTDTGLNVAALMPVISSASYRTYTFNGHTYEKIQVVTSADTTVTTAIHKVYRVYIAQHTGIIGYETFPQKELWYLQ